MVLHDGLTTLHDTPRTPQYSTTLFGVPRYLYSRHNTTRYKVNVRSAAAATLVIQSLDSYCEWLVVSARVTGMLGMWYSCAKRVRGGGARRTARMIYTWRSGGQNNSTSNKRLSVSSEFLPLEQVIGSEFQLWQEIVLSVAVVFLLYVVGDVRRGHSHVWP